jgi:hypothetical protein
MAIPKLALIPSTVGGSVYSVLPSNGDGDFNFTRASAATRINAQGLIETVAVGDNRLNYPLLDGTVQTCPHLLLEPQRTNLITYSEDFSNAAWTKSDSSITSNAAISPDGTLNADKVTGSGYLQNVNSLTATNTYTFSFFWKKDTSNVVKILLSSTGTDEQLSINTNTLALISQLGINSYNNISYGNDWYRLSMTWTEANTEPTGIRISADESDATSSLFIWGAMLEQSSYPTSYIPNYGTALGVTRSAETCNGAGDVNTFNDSEGVLMAEISALANDLTVRCISISSGNYIDSVQLRYWSSSNTLEYRVVDGSVIVVFLRPVINNIVESNKILVKYKSNDCSIWVNGFKIATDTSATMPSGLSELAFDDGNGTTPFYGNTKQIQYFPTALNDSDLETLTSWDSFSDMATSQLYTIE